MDPDIRKAFRELIAFGLTGTRILSGLGSFARRDFLRMSFNRRCDETAC